MRLLFKGHLLVLAVAAITHADGRFRAADASDSPTPETQCRLAAASKYEADNNGASVPWDQIPGPHAEEVCRKAVDISQGSSASKLRLARALIANGKFKEGKAILDETIANDESAAYAIQAEIARYGLIGLTNKKAAVFPLMVAAGKGNRVAMNDLGEMYYSGEGIERNVTTAAEWLNKAGDSRTASGSALLGYLYFNGEGVPRDDVRAVNLFKLAAPENCAARFGLAYARDNNRGGLRRGDQRKTTDNVGLQSAYLWVAKDTKCADHLRKAAQTRANEIGYEGSSYYAGSGSSGAGRISFGEAFQQALKLGAQTMEVVREGKKAGLITPEMEKAAERIGDDFNKRDAATERQRELDCLSSGYRGAAIGGGCAR